MRILVVALFGAFVISAQHGFAQSVTAGVQAQEGNERSREILALFNKTKHEVREKFGVRREKYKQIHSEAVVRRALTDYVGNYEVPDLGYTIQITASAAVTGSESQGDSHAVRHFHLEDANLEGALLTGTKVYADGERARFEGIFINMTDTEGVSPTEINHQATTFGLGVIEQVRVGSINSDKVFYQLTQ